MPTKNGDFIACFLMQIKMVKSGQSPSWEHMGNAYCLRIYPDYVEEAGELLKISLDDFELAVISW